MTRTDAVTQESSSDATEPRRRGRSVAAIVLGFAVVFVLSLGTDQVLHLLKIYPPWGEPMLDARLNLLALSYRLFYNTLGCYLTAWFAPRNPMRHALIGGAIGFVLSVAGALAAMQVPNLGPEWYPTALALSALPCAWLGGALYCRRSPARAPS
jgi:hypothetical protein